MVLMAKIMADSGVARSILEDPRRLLTLGSPPLRDIKQCGSSHAEPRRG